MAEEQTDKLAAAKSWERLHQNFEQRFPKDYVDPQKAKGTPLKPNQKSTLGNPWAANTIFPALTPSDAPPPQNTDSYWHGAPSTRRPLSPIPDEPMPKPPAPPGGGGIHSQTDPKKQTERIAELQEQHKSMMKDLEEFVNKYEHLGLMGINQLVRALNPVSSAQAGEVVHGNFLQRGIAKDLQKTPQQRQTQETLTRALGGASVLPMTPTNK